MEKNIKVLNDEGMHARPAGILAKRAAEFKSNIEIRYNGVAKSAKSIMGIMSLGLQKGSDIVLVAKGEDEAAAIEALTQLFNEKFEISTSSVASAN
jgi:phosphocarrier protein